MKHAKTNYCVCLTLFCLSEPVCLDIVSHIVKNLIYLLIFTATWRRCKVLFTIWAWTDSLFRDSWCTFNAMRTWFSKLYLTSINNNACYYTALCLDCCFFFIILRRQLFICVHSCVCMHLHVFTFMCFSVLLVKWKQRVCVWLRFRDNSFSSMIWFMGAVGPIGKNKVWSNLICLAFQLSFSTGKYHEKAEECTCSQCRLWSSGTRNMQIKILDYVNMQACKYRIKM